MPDDEVIFLFHIPKTGGTSLRMALSKTLGMNEGFAHIGPYGDKLNRKNKLKPLEERSRKELGKIQVVFGHYLSSDFEKYFAGRKIKRAIVLRDPSSRILSNYNHAMRNRIHMEQQIIKFHEWYIDQAKTEFGWEHLYGKKLTHRDKQFALASVGHNYMSKFILNATGVRNYQLLTDNALYLQASNILNGFWHVGKSEYMPSLVAVLEEALKVKLDVGSYNTSGGKLPVYIQMTNELRDYLKKNNAVDYRIYETYCG